MKFISKKSIVGALGLSLLTLGSCHSEQPEELPILPEVSDAPRVTLTISPISLGGTDDGVVEKIKTLRIIMISEHETEEEGTVSYVEFNRFIDFTDSPEFTGVGEYASYFRYVFTRPTVAGVKKFFLIANEGSVTPIHFQTEDPLPEGVSDGMLLKTFLNLYQPNYIPGYENLHGVEPGTGEPHGAELEALLNCLYYTPVFATEDGGDSIYLPYTSYYTFDMTDQSTDDVTAPPVNVLNTSMYLVPAANKFKFRFRNYRPSDVVIENFKISGMSADMYLFAQVNEKDQTKKMNSATLWWIDWLEAVSRLSYPEQGGFPSSDESGIFGQTYGWISDYEVPETAMPDSMDETINEEERHGVYDFTALGNPWSVESRDKSVPVNEAAPGEAQTGYFYMPESRNLVTQIIYDDNGEKMGEIEVQRYYLTLTMHDSANGSQSVTKDTGIGNLSSMFRNNNTLITVTLRDALDVGAYATPVEWGDKHSFGNVIEEGK